jgi:hypothetical protein
MWYCSVFGGGCQAEKEKGEKFVRQGLPAASYRLPAYGYQI